MKKFYLLAATMLLFASSAFAYYGEYNEPKTSGWDIFMAMVTIICAILGIILFFKVWGMTNDVRKITENYLAPKIKEDDMLLSYYLQKSTKGEEVAKQNLLDCIVKDILNSNISNYKTREGKEGITKEIEEKYKFILDYANIKIPNIKEYIDIISPTEFDGFKVGEKVRCNACVVTIKGFDISKGVVYAGNAYDTYPLKIKQISKINNEETQS